MRKSALLFAAFVFVLSSGGAARAASGSDLIDAVQSFVQTGLSDAASAFTPLRGASIKVSPGEHYEANKTFAPFFPDCHISGYTPPQVQITEWVLSCTSPGLGGVNVNQLRGLIYHGVVRALPSCFNRTLNPALLHDEDFRWDCIETGHHTSVDVSTKPTSNGDPSFLLEVYSYSGAPALPPTPKPAATPIVIQLVKPQAKLDMGGVQVPYEDYMKLSLMLQSAFTIGTSGVTPHVLETVKAGNEMPPFDWAWHYAGKQTQNGLQSISVWICGNLSSQEQTAALRQATLMGLLDSGLGGTVLQKAYADANTADTALGPQATDPFVNRRKLILSMAPFFR